MELRKASSPDMGVIEKLYYDNLVSLVGAADGIVPGLKHDTAQYLTDAKNNPVKSPLLQGVEKNIQLAFVSLMNQYFVQIEKDYRNKNKASAKLKLAKALYGGIESTAKRRGDYIKSQNVFHDRIMLAFDYLEKGTGSKDLAQVRAGIGGIKQAIDQVYFLSVL